MPKARLVFDRNEIPESLRPALDELANNAYNGGMCHIVWEVGTSYDINGMGWMDDADCAKVDVFLRRAGVADMDTVLIRNYY